MPMLGLGTWDLAGRATGAVRAALEAGYRHIDTAKIYDTEHEIGEAVRASGIQREELFITTKLWNSDQGYATALHAIDASLAALGMSYVDLYLVHWPDEDPAIRKETWKAMEEILDSGKARAIGVSNYEIEHLDEMAGYAQVKPAVNQFERHPYRTRTALVERCKADDMIVTAYAPLMRTHHFDDATLAAISRAHGRSVPQILLRWQIQHSVIAIPKSSKPEHIRENIAIFDFELSSDEMSAIDALDRDESVTD